MTIAAVADTTAPDSVPVTPRYVLAPYVATPHEVVERMLDLAEVGAGDVVCDLGCGDGRIAIAAARRGARGVGYDIEPYWVDRAREMAGRAGVAERTRFEVRDASELVPTAATVVALYLVEWSTERVGARLISELSPGTRIVSHSFSLKSPEPVRTERIVDSGGTPRTIRLWRVGGHPQQEAASPPRSAS
jgi:SAM-dependent methyltransferase